jgi:carboxylesterase
VESILLHDSYHMLTIDNEREQVAADTIRFFNAAHATRTTV